MPASLYAAVRASVSKLGYRSNNRNNITVDFDGSRDDVSPVRLAVFLEAVVAPESDNKQANQASAGDAQASNKKVSTVA